MLNQNAELADIRDFLDKIYNHDKKRIDLKWRANRYLAGDETRNVRHVAQEQGPDSVGDFAQAGVVPLPRVGRAATHEQLGAGEYREIKKPEEV